MKSWKKIFCSLFFAFFISSTFSLTLDSVVSYNSVHYRGAVMFNINEQSQVCQYNVVSVIDSFLYIQLNIIGLEAGRALLTPDNILFINKLQKKYYNGDYSVFEKILDIETDFSMIQDIFIGTPTMLPEGLELSYQTDSLFFEYPFFKVLNCEYDTFSLQLEVKRATFNAVPEVNATIPKNFTEIEIERENE
ncbi:MAG: DUF4292 domain-containing protein [Bacteroidales bacterium]|nr:DUF4292 domain-containing protein [Bacteroidales bacterium]